MLDSIVQILLGVLKFIGIAMGNTSAKKVEDVLPEKSASEKALEYLQQGKP